MDDYTGMIYFSKMEVIKNTNGRWTAIHSISQKRSKDLDEWEERSAEFMGEDISYDRAVAEALFSSAMYMQQTGGNLFQEPSEVDKSLLN